MARKPRSLLPPVLLAAVLLAPSCSDEDGPRDDSGDADADTDTDDDTGSRDADGDGWTAADDCDDADPAVNPGADEVCSDGVDNDCDGSEEPCGVWGTIDLGEADARLLGEEYDAEAGSALAAGDVDGDGVDDLLVGAPGEASGGREAGSAYVVPGPAHGTISLSEAVTKWVGEEADDHAGTSVVAGDVDGDGVRDVLVGAEGEGTGGPGAGAVYVGLGTVAATADLSLAEAKIVGEEAGDCAGRSLAAGDLDDDGAEEVVVGAYGGSAGGSQAGAVYVVHGPLSGLVDLSAAGAKLVGEDENDVAGWSVAVGDLDGDGVGDVLAGAPLEASGGMNAGAAYLVLGPVSGTVDLSMADAKVVGEDPGDYAGRSVGAGDVDGDGIGDVLVGAYGYPWGGYGGAVYAVLGPVAGLESLSAADAKLVQDGCTWVGESVAGGDVDGDGIGDVLVGAPHDDSGGTWAGSAWLVRGPIAGTVDLSLADAKLVGERPNDLAGAVVAMGDLDGSGDRDVLVGAASHDAGGEDAGAAYLLYGGSL